jgi:hypothetical protein
MRIMAVVPTWRNHGDLLSPTKHFADGKDFRDGRRVALALPVAFGKMRALTGHLKLHIPGPVEVSEKKFRALCSPMIGHRGQGFKDLYAKTQPQLQQRSFTRL